MSASVSAVVDVELWALRHSDFVDLLATCPSFARNISVILSRRLSVTNRGPRRALDRLMRLRVHPATPPGLLEELVHSVAQHLAMPLLLIDARASTHWRVGERFPALESVIGDGELLEELHPRHSVHVVALQAQGVSVETWARFRSWISEQITHLLLVTDIAPSTPTFLSIEGDVAIDLTLWPPEEGALVQEVGDVALLTGQERANTRRALERMSRQNGARVVRAVALEGPDRTADLAWLARHLAGLKVGLALGAGGMRGFAHVGVLRRFEQAQIPIDYVAGCSVGALIASACVTGMNTEAMMRESYNFAAQTTKFTLSRRSLLSSRGLQYMYRDRLFGGTEIEDTELPLAIIAVDVMRHVEVVLERGPLWMAILASTALPGVYPPVQVHNRWLVDGGLLDPVPAGVTRALGADIVLSVSLGGLRSQKPESFTAGDPDTVGPAPHVIDVLLRSFDIMGNRITARVLEEADVTMVANIEPMGLRDFHRVPELVSAGEQAVEQVWPRVTTLLPWLRHA